MGEWREAKLGDLGQIVGGGTPSRDRPDYWDGTIRWLTPGELTGRAEMTVCETADQITESGLASSGARVVPPNTVLVTTRATLGSCALAGCPMATNQGFKNLIPTADLDPQFLYYLMGTLRRELTRRASGTTFLEVSGKEFAQVAVSVPPLAEQRRIAEILDTIDETIQATERVIAKLEASLAGIIAAQSELEYPSAALGHLASKMTNGFVGTATPYYTTAEAGGVPYLYGTNVRPNALDISAMRHVQPSFHARQVKSRLMPGDLLTVQSGHIGTTCVVPDRLGEANCHALIITRVDQALLRPRFIAEFVNSPLGMSQMRRLFVGSTILHINVKDLLAMECRSGRPSQDGSCE